MADQIRIGFRDRSINSDSDYVEIASHTLGDYEAGRLLAVAADVPPGAWPYLALRIRAGGRVVWSTDRIPIPGTDNPLPLGIDVPRGSEVIYEGIIAAEADNTYTSSINVRGLAVLESWPIGSPPAQPKPAEIEGPAYGVAEAY